MLGVDGDLNKDIQHFHGGYGDRDQAAVAVVDQQVASQSLGGQVIDATRAVCHVSQNHTLTTSELLEYIRDGTRIYEEPFWKLKSHGGGFVLK